MKFEEAIAHVLSEEGGYVNNKKDPGGETKFGISKRSYPKIDIKNLTREQAVLIYRRDYWMKIRADELPDNINLHIFDFAVNAGAPTAIKLLQSICKIKKDGIVGPNTLTHSYKITPWQYAAGRVKHYCDLAKRKPDNLEFIEGWVNRTLNITEICTRS